MKKKMIALLPALWLTIGPASAALLPGDPAKGKALHDKQCVACHDSHVYTRSPRRVNSVEGLIGQVKGCAGQLGLKLDRDQTNDLVNYLDQTYYKFK